MAIIPDNAIDRMYDELTSGARDLYTFLCRCRNQQSGKCCPSVSTTQDALKLSRARVFALRKELAGKGWAEFEGNYAVQLFGFNSLKNKTIHELAKEDSSNDGESLKNKTLSLENETAEIEEVEETNASSLEIETDNVETADVIQFPNASLKNKTEDAESLENETAANGESLENKTKSLENKTNESQKQDLHVRKNQQREPAKRTSKEETDMLNSGSTAVSGSVLQVFDYWKTTLDHPRAILDAKRKKFVRARLDEKFSVDDLKAAIDGCRASPWHMGQNPHGTVWDDLTLICRDAAHVEMFIAKVGTNGKSQTGKTNGNDTTQNGARRTTEDYGIRDCKVL